MQPEEFKQIRQKLGYSQIKLAEILGVSRDVVQRYEYGQLKLGIKPSVAHMMRTLLKEKENAN